MGRSEATTIFPEPAENAKSGAGQVISALSDSAAVAGSTVVHSSVRLIVRSKMASIAIAILVDTATAGEPILSFFAPHHCSGSRPVDPSTTSGGSFAPTSGRAIGKRVRQSRATKRHPISIHDHPDQRPCYGSIIWNTIETRIPRRRHVQTTLVDNYDGEWGLMSDLPDCYWTAAANRLRG